MLFNLLNLINLKCLISDYTMFKSVNTSKLAKFLIEISILKVVYLVAVLLPPLLVMLKVGIVINDALRQENSGEKLLLHGDIMKNAPRMNKTAIMPYLLVPKVKYPWRMDYRSLSQRFDKFDSKRNDSGKFTIFPHSRKTSEGGGANKIVILVLTAPKNFEKRKRMRSFTIGEEIPELLFLLGTVADEDLQNCLEEENRMFGDMLQISVKDSYQNLPYKTISGFDYVSQFRTDVAFILKTDDDLKLDTAALR